MQRIVQCIPNFSEGRRPEVIKSIVDAMKGASDAKVIDYSWDVDHNRSVVTLIGAPEAVKSAFMAGAKVAVELIDMNRHQGVHPRVGAIDVVPVVPVSGCTMDDCIELSKQIGQELSKELGIPVYFYESTATSSSRVNLADIRKGGFESLKGVELVGDRKPDLGSTVIHPTAGVTVVGARGPLIAYNVNLDTSDLSVARKIAKLIRDKRDNDEGMIGVKAIGVNLASRGIVQVSTNITQPKETSVFEVFDFIKKSAFIFGIEVLESELIGVMREDDLYKSFSESIKLPLLDKSRVIDSWLF